MLGDAGQREGGKAGESEEKAPHDFSKHSVADEDCGTPLMPIIRLGTLHVINLEFLPHSYYFYPSFPDEETEAQRGNSLPKTVGQLPGAELWVRCSAALLVG